MNVKTRWIYYYQVYMDVHYLPDKRGKDMFSFLMKLGVISKKQEVEVNRYLDDIAFVRTQQKRVKSSKRRNSEPIRAKDHLKPNSKFNKTRKSFF